jgi:type I restriction enzyme, S subunit
MGQYQGYEKYKESGVEWLGDIPKHWDAKRLKFISQKVQTGTTPPSNREEYYQDGDVNWFAPSDFSEDNLYLKEAKKKINRKALEDGIVKQIPRGSILIIGIGATLGKVGLLDVDATSNQQVNAILLNRNINSTFVAYFLLVLQEIMKIISNSTTLGILNQEKTKQIPLTIPPLDEQESIAHFLDRKTSQIDALIAKKEALLEKLDEKRTALISHAVTKGLDPNVPMKNSGVEWLGDIPKHWTPIKLKYLCSLLRDGTHLPPPRVTTGVPLLSVRNIINGKFVNLDDDSLISEEDFKELNKSFEIYENDIVLATVGATLGKVAVVEKMPKFTIQRSIAVLRPKEGKCLFKFLFYFLKSPDFQNLLWMNTGFSAQPGIYLGSLQNFFILMPTLIEQEKIVEYLDRKTQEIDRQKAKVKAAIKLLKEYRTALITNAVTGKIDVRQVSSP